MPLGLPDLEDDPTDKPIKVDENHMTVFRDNDKMVYYMGLLANSNCWSN
jgi:hypothetical protein